MRIASAVIATIGGTNYALHHVVNIWRGTELGWNDQDNIDALGKTMTNIRYYMKDGSVTDYPVEIRINEDQAAADAVTNQISRLKEQAGLEDQDAIKAAQDAYDALTEEQKALVREDALNNRSGQGICRTGCRRSCGRNHAGRRANWKYTVTAQGRKAVFGEAAVPGTVTVAGYADASGSKSETSITIPDQITEDGVTLTVTAIGAGAFKGSKKRKNVTIGANVASIGSKAFQNCRKLKKVVIRSSVLKTVGSKAFAKAGSSNYRKLTVKDPKAKLKSYRKLLKRAKLSARAKVKK